MVLDNPVDNTEHFGTQMAARLYLITHAHTQPEKRIDPTRWRLSTNGEMQAARLAEQPFWRHVDRVVLSREPKTRLTVEPVLAQRALPVLVDGRFDELQRGSAWVQNYTARVAQVFAHPSRGVGGWEAADAALVRFRAGIADLKSQYAGETMALLGHGLTLSLYRAHLLGQELVALADWRRLSFAAVAEVDLGTDTLLRDFHPIAGAMARG